MAIALKLIETKGNIFHIPLTFSLAHAVSADFETAKGSLAWQFNVIFGQLDELSQSQIDTGNVAALEHNSRFIYFLVTKEILAGRSSYENVEAGLFCMREHMRNHGISKVALPRICCGNDRLDWKRIKEIILRVFHSEFNVEIMICQHSSPDLSLPKYEITEVKGSLFTAPSEFSLVHSIGADFTMCQGIALEFKCKFGQINELIRQNKHTGNVAVIQDNERFIYNLITKDRSHERCTYPALYYALVAMREHMLENKVTKLAIPRLGCGIDRLDWHRVRNLLEYVFAEDKVRIITYVNEERAKSTSLTRLNVDHNQTYRQAI